MPKQPTVKTSSSKSKNYYQVLSTLGNDNKVKKAKLEIKARVEMGCRQKPVQQLTENFLINVKHETPIDRQESTHTSKDCLTTTLHHKDHSIATYCTVDDVNRDEKTWRDVFEQTETHVARELKGAMNTACDNKYPGTEWNGEAVPLVEAITKDLKESHEYDLEHYTRTYLCKETQSEFSSGVPLPNVNIIEPPIAEVTCIDKRNKKDLGLKNQNYFAPLSDLPENFVEPVKGQYMGEAELSISGLTSQVTCSKNTSEISQYVFSSSKKTDVNNSKPLVTSDCISKPIKVKQDTEQVVYCRKEDNQRDEKTWRNLLGQTEQHVTRGFEKLLDGECDKKYPGSFWNRKPVEKIEEIKTYIANKHDSFAKYERESCYEQRGPMWATYVRGPVNFGCVKPASSKLVEGRNAYTPNLESTNIGGALAIGTMVGVVFYSLYKYFINEDTEKKIHENQVGVLKK